MSHPELLESGANRVATDLSHSAGAPNLRPCGPACKSSRMSRPSSCVVPTSMASDLHKARYGEIPEAVRHFWVRGQKIFASFVLSSATRSAALAPCGLCSLLYRPSVLPSPYTVSPWSRHRSRFRSRRSRTAARSSPRRRHCRAKSRSGRFLRQRHPGLGGVSR